MGIHDLFLQFGWNSVQNEFDLQDLRQKNKKNKILKREKKCPLWKNDTGKEIPAMERNFGCVWNW